MDNKNMTENTRTRRTPVRRKTASRGRRTELSPASRGAVAGASAWLAYASVETFFSVILPWFMVESYDYRPFHRGFTAMLFILYPAFGAALGALAGLATGRRERSAVISASAALFIIIAVFDINLVLHYPPAFFSVKATLALSVIFSALIIAAAVSERWSARLAFATNPWTVCTALAGIMWLVKDRLWDTTALGKGFWVLGYVGAILAASFVVQFVWHRAMARHAGLKSSRRRGRALVPAGRHTGAGAASVALTMPVAVITLLVSLLPHQSVLMEPSAAGAAGARAGRTNVILIVMDTVRADHLSAYGYDRKTTPNLDRFATESVLFKNAIAPGAMTLSSHASLFTGLYPRAHGAHFDPWAGYPGGKPLGEKFTTLTEILGARGFRTTGVAANIAFLSHAYRIDQGFEHFDCRWPKVFLSDAWAYYIKRGVRDILTNFSVPEKFDKFYRNAGEINGVVWPLLDSARRDQRPLFLFINYMDAHDPYTPPAPFDTLYPGKIEGYTAREYNELTKQVLKRERKVTPREREHLVSQYDGGVAYVDDSIGALFVRLKELGLYDSSLIIVTADHGEAFGEKDHFEHGNSVYQDQVHVPLMIKRPFAKEAGTVDVPVSLVDILPTVLEEVGAAVPDGLPGRDILADKLSSRTVIAETYPDGFLVNWGNDRFNGVKRAVVDGTDKFIGFTRGDKELYDLSNDPNEERDIYSEDDGRSKGLDKTLSTWVETTVEETGKAEAMSREAAERLKALGYVQ